jgi:soluble lytic murein transglycosylase-like protein
MVKNKIIIFSIVISALFILTLVFLALTLSGISSDLKDVIKSIEEFDIKLELEKQKPQFIPQLESVKYDYDTCATLTSLKILQMIEKHGVALAGKEKIQFANQILTTSKKFDLDPIFLAALIARESNFNVNAVSTANALGPGQVIPKWHKEKLEARGIEAEGLKTIQHGVDVSGEVIREYLDKNNDDYVFALHSYVGSNGYRLDYIQSIFKIYNEAQKSFDESKVYFICSKI